MKSHRTPLTEGPVRDHLIAMTVPMLWGLMALMGFHLADTWFVSRLGAGPLAAMSFTFPVNMVLTSVAIGLGAGTASVIARAIGARDEQRVRRLATDAMALSLILSVALAAVGIATIDPLFRLLGATDDLLPLIRGYMTIWYVGLPLFIVPMSALAAIRATGDSRLPGKIMIAAALLNVVLDPILIFGLFGAPRLELEGAAWASVLARTATGAVAAVVVLKRYDLIELRPVALRELVSSWRAVLHVGLPAAGTNAIIHVSNGVIVAMLAGYGPEAVAGFGVATRVEAMALVVFYAMSAIIGPIVGQNLGAGRGDRIDGTMRLCVHFSLAFGLVLAIVLWITAPSIARLFSADEHIVDTATLYLRIVPISYGAASIVMIVNAAFNGIGRPLPAMVVSIGRMVGLYLPLAFLGGWLAGVAGIFAAYAAANLAMAAIAQPWFARTHRR